MDTPTLERRSEVAAGVAGWLTEVAALPARAASLVTGKSRQSVGCSRQVINTSKVKV
jgi:hypothetical protein